MAFLDSMNISASALTAQRYRMDIIAENIANINTTRTAEGGAYRRKYVVFEAVGEGKSFTSILNDAAGAAGVRISMVGEDPSDFKLEYDPSHPDANEEGYVQHPNVDLTKEMIDMISAYRSYEANITAFNAFKDMAVKTLEIGV